MPVLFLPPMVDEDDVGQARRLLIDQTSSERASLVVIHNIEREEVQIQSIEATYKKGA